jgi:quercetin dioxygenase-like cupin family protein
VQVPRRDYSLTAVLYDLAADALCYRACNGGLTSLIEGRKHMITPRAMLPLLGLAMIAVALGADTHEHEHSTAHPAYAYATNGVKDHIVDRGGNQWKLLLDKSNLGGDEIEAVELTMPAGLQVASHTHKSVEVIYVLSGTYGHEVNGKLYLLKPGMIGIVRPGDHVRHLVPKSGPAKVLIIWAPAGEAERLQLPAKGEATEPVPEAKALDP